jgi:transposase
VRENLPNAQVVFDKFHVIAIVNGAVDEVRRAEAREADQERRQELKDSRWIFRKNRKNLTAKQQARLAEMDLTHLITGVAYQMRLYLQRVYRCRTAETAQRMLSDWCHWSGARPRNWVRY